MPKSALTNFLLTAVLLFLASSAAAQEAATGFRIDQLSKTYGDHQLSVCKFGLRLDSPKNGITLITVPPYQEVVVFCRKTKRMVKSPFVKFEGVYDRAFAMFRGSVFKEVPIIANGSATICGITALKYTEPPGWAKKQDLLKKQNEVSPDAPTKVTYLASKEVCNDSHQGEVVARYLGLPKVPAMPLQFKLANMKGEPRFELDTSICKKAQFKDSDFRTPSDYLVVKDGSAIFVDKNSEDAVEMMIGAPKNK